MNDFNFVIHGGGITGIKNSKKPFQESEARKNLLMMIHSIRKNFPNNKIILSTWFNEDLTNIDIDEVFYSMDPGDSIASKKYNYKSSINRHIVSSKKGIFNSDSKYSILIRPDIYFINDNLKYYIEDNISNLDNDKIICLAGGTLNEKTLLRKPFPFHICDFIYIGNTLKLKEIFKIPNETESNKNIMFLEEKKSKYPEKFNYFLNIRNRDSYIQQYIPECYVVYHAFKEKYNINHESSYDYSNANKIKFQEILRNEFLLSSRSMLGLKWLKNNNEYQPNLLGIIGRYSYYLFRSRISNNIIIKFVYYILHNLRQFYLILNILFLTFIKKFKLTFVFLFYQFKKLIMQ